MLKTPFTLKLTALTANKGLIKCRFPAD